MAEILKAGSLDSLRWQIVVSKKSGVPSGEHLVITLLDDSEPTTEQVGRLLGLFIAYADERYPDGRYRLEMNSMNLRGGKGRGWHAHLKVLGAEDELPRCVDSFVRVGDTLVAESPATR